jgi:protein-arginine kinase activator protein McsA
MSHSLQYFDRSEPNELSIELHNSHWHVYQLEIDLEIALENELYEEACPLRDKINYYKKKIEKEKYDKGEV